MIPGIHINLIGAILVSLSASKLYFINPIYLATFISSLAITHTFLDFIPSIFLGCPDTGTELSILPGHELLKQGRGYDAVMKTAYGGLYAVIALFILFIPFSFFLKAVYGFLQKIIPFLLIGVCILMVLTEKKKFSGALVLILTGILGYIVLGLDLKEPLLPMLSGLFGSSMIILSIQQNTKIPKQIRIFEKLSPKKILKPLFGAIVSSPLCGFLPGLGSGQAAVIGNQIIKLNQKDFLILLGAVNTLVMGLSFVCLYSISRTRTGAAVAIQEILTNFNIKMLSLIIFVCLIVGIICFILTKYLSLKFIEIFEKINYKNLSIGILIFLSILVLVISGLMGFVIFTLSTFTGIYCIKLNVKRTQMMGCLLIPTIILYLI